MNNVSQAVVNAAVSPLIGQDEFVVAFSPIKASANGDNMVQTYSEAQKFASKNGYGDDHIWAITEGDDESLYAVAGFHVIKVLGFVITEKPWVTGIEEALWYECEEEEEADW